MVLNPVLGCTARRFLPLSSLERKVFLIDELAEQNWPISTLLRIAAVHGSHELVAFLLGIGLGQASDAQSVMAAMPAIVVVEHYPFLVLAAPPKLEASFLPSFASQEFFLLGRKCRFGVP
jgi:hypothetical protein